MTKLTIVARNPNPSPTHHNPPTLRLVSNDCHDGARLRFEKEMATVRGDGLVSRRFNDCPIGDAVLKPLARFLS